MKETGVHKKGRGRGVVLEVLYPCGEEAAETIPFAKRLDSLEGKTICELSNAGWEHDRVFPVIRELLQKRFPSARIIPYTELPLGRGRAGIDTDQTADAVLKRGCDAVVTGMAAWGGCSTESGRAAARVEKLGIPTVTVTRQGFSIVVDNAFAGLGFAADAAKTVFPIPMFLPGSDLTPIERGIDEIIAGLTKWEPKLKAKKVTAPRKIRVEGKDYEDAVTNMNNLFLKNLWSDGLPIRPATEERVSWILTGTDLSPDTVIGKILPRGGIATVQSIAISLAMAGGRPEYLPVLIAVVEAIIDPRFRHFHMNATTCSSYPAVIVNGPIAKQIRLNSGYGCLGPSSTYPAGASIGRAIRFILMNMGGGVPGIGSMAIYGGPARYTGLVFAEDEDGIPAGWEPLNVERGFTKGSNTVTVHSISGTTNICSASTTTEDVALETLNRFAGFMRAPNDNLFTMPHTPDGAPGILLIGRGSARGLADLGWSKEKVKTYLWEHTFLSESEMPRRVLEKRARDGWMAQELVRCPTPIAVSPKNIMIVVAGGAQSGHAYWMEVGCCPYAPISAAVKLPANWGKLLEAAADDLGPPPSSA